jgi:hypothetical protein
MFFIPGANLAGTALRFAALSAAFFFVLSWIKANCGCFRKCDIRKIPGIKKLFLKLGLDEYPEFYLIVTVHNVKDVEHGGGLTSSLLGSTKYYAYINAKYEYMQTRCNSRGKYEQTSKLLVPQGTEDVVISIYSASTVMQDNLIGVCNVNVSKFLGPLSEEYVNKKKAIKVNAATGGSAGVVNVTFRKGDAGTLLDHEIPIISGLDPDQRPALYGELLEFVEAQNASGTRNLKYTEKLNLLANVLNGKLTASTKGTFSKKAADVGNFWAVVELEEDDSDASSSGGSGDREPGENKISSEKARKWYLGSYESEKYFTKNKDEPEMVIPLLSVTSVNKLPGEEGATTFTLRFVDHSDKKKKEMFFRCGPNRDVDVWVDGLEMFREELREMKTLAKQRKAKWEQLTEGQKMNEWMSYYKDQGYSEEELKRYYQQYKLALMGEKERVSALKAAAKQVVSSQSSEVKQA